MGRSLALVCLLTCVGLTDDTATNAATRARRSQLEMSARALAKTIGVVHESISRWENGVLPVSSPVDRLMRTMVALTISGEKFPVETLSHIEGDAGPLKLVVTVDSKGSWRRAA